MKKRIVLWSLLLMFALTVTVQAAEIKGAVCPPGTTLDDLVHRVDQSVVEQAEVVCGPLKYATEPDEEGYLKAVIVKEPVVDSQGEPVSLERTNELIVLVTKLQEHIKLLQEHASYLDIIVDKRNQERKDSELMYLKLRRAVELAQKR